MRAVLLSSAVVILAGCPDIGRMTYRFDLANGTGSLTLDDIGTDNPGLAAADFATLVNDYLLGEKVQEEHPTWRVGERRLYEDGGRLDGIVEFTFERPADAGLYQHSRKTDLLWCAGEGETVVSTSGAVVPLYPNCVFFDRKQKQHEVTVTTGEGLGDRTSLLPLYEAWDGKPIAVSDGRMTGVGEMFGEAFRAALGDPPAGQGPNLSAFLPDVDIPGVWKELGLPIAGSKPVFSSERSYGASHPDSAPQQVVAAYEALLTRAGFTAVAPGTDPSVWTKGEDRISITATSAGSTVVVDLAR